MENHTRLLKIEKQIRAIKRELMEIGEMRPGSLTCQKRKRKEMYGEYWQLSYTHKNKGHTEYIRKAHAASVKHQIDNYSHFRALISKWITLAITHAQLKLKSIRDVELGS